MEPVLYCKYNTSYAEFCSAAHSQEQHVEKLLFSARKEPNEQKQQHSQLFILMCQV